MIKYCFPILYLLTIITPANGQMYIRITGQPAVYQALYDSLHIPSSVNNWDPGVKTDIAGENLYIIPAFSGTMKYKVTRGTWLSVEGSASGGEIPDRSLAYQEGDTADISIASWKDLYSSQPHTATGEVKILKSDFSIPQFNRKRRIWVYLPPDYATGNRSYPVLYMHDGQNLFDRALSFAGEWKVDEALDQLSPEGKDCIVVGIDNGGGDRIEEYTPYRHPSYGGGRGELYVSFLVNTLKPFIDSHFRTLAQPEHTGIAGSSLGGLISFYAGIKHPEIFGKVGVFSPSFWFSDSLKADVESYTASAGQKFYIVAGQNEDEDMVPDIDTYIGLLQSQGIQSEQIRRLIHQDGQHSEWYWAREFPEAYRWLDLWNEGSASATAINRASLVNMLGNPADRPSFRFSPQLQSPAVFMINDSSGKQLFQASVQPGEIITVDSLKVPGTYFATVKSKDQSDTVKFIKK